MTTRFRIDRVVIGTVSGEVGHNFTGDLVVLAGDIGVGKTTLLELIKFGLGGDGRLAPVVETSVVDVQIDLQIGDERLALTRSVSENERGTVRVIDLITAEQLADRSVASGDDSVSSLLMEALQLPTDLRAAPLGSKSTSPGSRISFNDIWKYMYVPQSDINQEVAGSSNNYYEPKRRAVFELLFGITNPEILELRSQFNQLKGEANDAHRQAEIVEQFLADSNTSSKADAQQEQHAGVAAERRARAELAALRSAIGEVVDWETQALRDLLTSRERALADARNLAVQLSRDTSEYERERRRVQQDAARLDRMVSAGERLANIEFVVCPRCTQRLDNRQTPPGACRVCLQTDIVADLPDGGYEREQLTAQFEEIDEQLAVLRVQTKAAERAAVDREALVVSLNAQIEERTADRITPRLQAYADAHGRIERAVAQQRSTERVLLQWDRLDDLRATAAGLETRRAQLEARIAGAVAAQQARKDEILGELNEEFRTTVDSFAIPNGQSASIDSTTYLPFLAGHRFDDVSLAGGIATATQVAYWLSLITVALRRRDTLYPAFLLIDSPQLALNNAMAIAEPMYRRFVTQVQVNIGRLQVIIADNQLPGRYSGEFTEITFSYDRPTISTITHPGPTVQTLVPSTGVTDSRP